MKTIFAAFLKNKSYYIMKFKLLVLGIIPLLFSCKSVKLEHFSCKDFPTNFHSNDQVIILLKSTHFAVNQSLLNNGRNGEWGQKVTYYSCDGKTGFILFETAMKEYVFQNVPVSKWNHLKKVANWGWFFQNHLNKKEQYYVNLESENQDYLVKTDNFQRKFKYKRFLASDTGLAIDTEE